MMEGQKTGISGGRLNKNKGQFVDEEVEVATSADLCSGGVCSISTFIAFTICKIRKHVKICGNSSKVTYLIN